MKYLYYSTVQYSNIIYNRSPRVITCFLYGDNERFVSWICNCLLVLGIGFRWGSVEDKVIMAVDDLVMTIEDDDDVCLVSESEEEEENCQVSRSCKKGKGKNAKKRLTKKEEGIDLSFDFEEDELSSTSWNFLGSRYSNQNESGTTTSINDKIKAKLMEREDEESDIEEDGEEVEESDSESKDESDHDNEDNSGRSDQDESGDEESEDEVEDQMAEDRIVDKFNKQEDESDEEESFFAPAPEEKIVFSFADMNLSRPLMKACTALGYVVPTPVQSRCIPVGMMGKDICACAETGSGKTAAFFLPVLERLIFRPKKIPVSRVLVLSPTRELLLNAIMCVRN